MLSRWRVLLGLVALVCSGVWAVGENVVVGTPGVKLAAAVRNYAPRYTQDGGTIAYLRGTDANKESELWVMDGNGQNAHAVLTRQSLLGMPKDALPLTLDPSCSLTITDFAWTLTRTLVCRVTITSVTSADYLLQVSPSGAVLPVKTETGEPVTPTAFAIDPRGKSVAVFDKSGCRLFPIEAATITPPTLATIATPNLWCEEATWGSDNRIYCTMTPLNQDKTVPSGIYMIDPAKSTVEAVMPPGGERCPGLSSYGRLLTFLRGRQLLARILATGEETEVATDVTAYRWTNNARVLMLRQLDNLTRAGDRGTRETYIEIIDPARMKTGLANPTRADSFRLALNRISFLRTDLELLSPVSMPDISFTAGQRLVYEWEGALYLLDFNFLG